MMNLQAAHAIADRTLQELAATNGWAIATWWPSARPAGTKPRSALHRLERAAAVGRAHELALQKEERRQRGAHLTPAKVASTLAQRVLAQTTSIQRVLDPCCGAGIFLVAAQAHHPEPLELHGSDLNNRALAFVWASFALAFPDTHVAPDLNLRSGDGLLMPLPTCDAVLTNPPFRSSMRQASADEKKLFAAYRKRWKLGARGRSDLSMSFLEACARSLNKEGWLGAVLPEPQLASASGQALRAWLCEAGSPRHLEHLGMDAFPDANVRTCTLLWQAGTANSGDFQACDGAESKRSPADQLLDGAWAKHFINRHRPPILHSKCRTQPLGELVELRRLFTDDFYFVGRAMREAGPKAEHPVITVAHVEPGHHLWGQRTARVAGKRWQRPEVDYAALRAEDAVRARRLKERWTQPRVGLATRGKVIEACRLASGYVAQVPLLELWSDNAEETALTYAQLLSPPATAWYLYHHGAADQTGAGIDLRAGMLKALPLIPAAEWPDDLRQRALAQIAILDRGFDAEALFKVQCCVIALYEAAEDSIGWWWERAPKRMARPSSFSNG